MRNSCKSLWYLGVAWDVSLPSVFWETFMAEYPELLQIKTPRDILPTNSIFNDASCKGLPQGHQLTGHAQIYLSLIKSKVTPIKTILLPRLELCSTQFGAKLLKYILNCSEIFHLYCMVRLYSCVMAQIFNTSSKNLCFQPYGR
ncbi:hypothetical protein PR048_022239 [Dryococelus australis]|uniref:Reverse transcriptase n=1 Tax=Dryococelus australis TaxID=614101 RepID=A0ABQ9H0G8_9NEOP|nr:hypothetical protein PR048_022239 [Dryococelus australis]